MQHEIPRTHRTLQRLVVESLKKTQTQSCTQLLSLLYIWKCSMKTAAYRFCRVGVLRVRKGSTSSYLLPEEANTAFFAPSKLRHTSSFSLAGVNQPRQGDALYCVTNFSRKPRPTSVQHDDFIYIFVWWLISCPNPLTLEKFDHLRNAKRIFDPQNSLVFLYINFV